MSLPLYAALASSAESINRKPDISSSGSKSVSPHSSPVSILGHENEEQISLQPEAVEAYVVDNSSLSLRRSRCLVELLLAEASW